MAYFLAAAQAGSTPIMPISFVVVPLSKNFWKLGSFPAANNFLVYNGSIMITMTAVLNALSPKIFRNWSSSRQCLQSAIRLSAKKAEKMTISAVNMIW